jgi:hypothetical protein
VYIFSPSYPNQISLMYHSSLRNGDLFCEKRGGIVQQDHTLLQCIVSRWVCCVQWDFISCFQGTVTLQVLVPPRSQQQLTEARGRDTQPSPGEGTRERRSPRHRATTPTGDKGLGFLTRDHHLTLYFTQLSWLAQRFINRIVVSWLYKMSVIFATSLPLNLNNDTIMWINAFFFMNDPGVQSAVFIVKLSCKARATFCTVNVNVQDYFMLDICCNLTSVY